jgi:L-seryl-tRNA(Ser) seleniumtransferase
MSIAASGIYEELGVRRVINAAGTKTVLGGSRMPQPVIDAMVDAARAFVTMRELQEKAGQRIAELVGVEAAMVSSGAAGGILLSVAACIAGTDPEKIRRLPHLEDRNEVVVGQEEPNYIYQAAEAAGGRLVHVGARDRLDVDDFAAAIGDRTAAVFLVVYMLDRRRGRGAATATVPAMARLARARGVPVVVDAAGELPPTRNFRRFLDEGVDLVVFSGGKASVDPRRAGSWSGGGTSSRPAMPTTTRTRRSAGPARSVRRRSPAWSVPSSCTCSAMRLPSWLPGRTACGAWPWPSRAFPAWRPRWARNGSTTVRRSCRAASSISTRRGSA